MCTFKSHSLLAVHSTLAITAHRSPLNSSEHDLHKQDDKNLPHLRFEHVHFQFMISRGWPPIRLPGDLTSVTHTISKNDYGVFLSDA